MATLSVLRPSLKCVTIRADQLLLVADFGRLVAISPRLVAISRRLVAISHPWGLLGPFLVLFGIVVFPMAWSEKRRNSLTNLRLGQAQACRTPPSNPPRPPLLKGLFGIEISSNQEGDRCRIDAKSAGPLGGEGEADSRVRSGGGLCLISRSQLYHSFRNHYIFNSKTIFYVTVTVIFGK